MAQIPSYTAKKLLTPAGALDTNVHDFVGAQVEKLGSTISQVGERYQARIDQREEFKAQNDYNKFQYDLGNDLTDNATNNMPEGGIGFHDNFMGSIYKTRRDEFLQKIPARLKEKFETIVADNSGANFGEWATKAAGTERDATRAWASDTIKTNSDQLANAIALNPEQYEARLKQGNDLIDTVPMMSAQEKKQLKADWENMAQVAHLNSLMETNPEDVLKVLGANPNHLSPGSQFELLKQAVTTQESGGNPLAISSRGAAGKMQVMPDTAREIAKETNDPNFPDLKGLSVRDQTEAITEYLQTSAGEKYGEFYLRKMMNRYPGDVEAALVAYNGGPGTADKWIKNGRDDRVLAAETRKYYKQVLARLPGLHKEDIPNLPQHSDANAFLKKRISLEGRQEGVLAVDNLNPEFQSRLAAFISSAPPEIQKGLGLFSAWRSKEHQAALFAKSDRTGHSVARPGHSNHEFGAAADMAWNGQSLKNAPKDVVAWVHDNAARFGLKFPLGHENWHVEMSETRGGKPSMTAAGRYASLPYDKRQSFINSADTELSRRLQAQRSQDAVTRVQTQSAMDNELALVKATGKGSGGFDETSIIPALGNDDYMKYIDRKIEAQKTFTATDGIEHMSPDDMQHRINDYTPNPDAADFVSQQRIHAAVVKKADEIVRERAKEPDKAALRFPDAKAAWDKVNNATGTPDPADVKALVATMLAHQQDFGVMPKAQAPIPSEWAFAIGKSLASRTPDVSKETKLADVRASIAVQYMALEKVFGEYTDEVVLYSLSQYKGMTPTTAKRITAMMTTIAHGGDPFKPLDTLDQDQVEGSSWFQSLGEWWNGGGDPEATAQPINPNTPPDPETVLRVIGRLNSVDTPEDEAVLVEQYGRAAVEAAKLRIKQGDQ